MKITIVGGMDFIGLVNAVGFAEKGHEVFALDSSDKKKIAALRKHELPRNEPKLEEILTRVEKNIRFTAETRDAIYGASVLILSTILIL